MKLFHASKTKFDVIKRSQALAAEGLEVPEGELQNKIYFTPEIGVALAMGARPPGITSISGGKISFENVDEFDPEEAVYIYEIDIEEDLVEFIDDEQVTIDLDEIRPSIVHEFKAKDVFDYYELSEWRPPAEYTNETKFN